MTSFMEIKSTKTLYTVGATSETQTLSGEITVENGKITRATMQVTRIKDGKFANYSMSQARDFNENINGSKDFIDEARTFAKAQLAEFEASLNMEGQE